MKIDSEPFFSSEIQIYPLTAIIGENFSGKSLLLEKIRFFLENKTLSVGNKKIVVGPLVNVSSYLTENEKLLGKLILKKFFTPLKPKEFSKQEFESLNLPFEVDYNMFNQRFYRLKELFGNFLPLTYGKKDIFSSIGLIFFVKYLEFSDDVFPIFFLEEPEIHLHPQGQIHFKKVMKQLSSHMGFVYTTHSPFMITGLEWTSIIRLSKEKSLLKIFQINSNILGKSVFIPEKISLELASALFSRVVLLVEGDTERVFINNFVRKFFEKDDDPLLDLEELGIQLLPVYGNNFHPYLKLFSAQGFSIPSIVLADKDSMNKILKALKDLKPDLSLPSNKAQKRNILQRNNCFLMQENFEKDFFYKSRKLIELVLKKYYPNDWKEIKYKAKNEKELQRLVLSFLKHHKVSVARFLSLEARKNEVPVAIIKALNRSIELASMNSPQTLWRPYDSF